jgi:hypothetical protein
MISQEIEKRDECRIPAVAAASAALLRGFAVPY